MQNVFLLNCAEITVSPSQFCPYFFKVIIGLRNICTEYQFNLVLSNTHFKISYPTVHWLDDSHFNSTDNFNSESESKIF